MRTCMALHLCPLLPSTNDNHWLAGISSIRENLSSSPAPASLFLAHGEVGGGRQRRTALTEAPDRRRRRGGLGTGEAACRFSSRTRFEHSSRTWMPQFECSNPQCSSPSNLDAPGLLAVCRGWLACPQGLSRSSEECRQITWAGQPASLCVGQLGCHSQTRHVF